MKQPNSFIDSMVLTCVLINFGLFLFAVIIFDPHLQLLSLFNIACFLVYFLAWGKT